ncbi:Serine/threonine-protein kinase TEL1 [Tolypocladium capitatum]|uniref:Serine/threonine-protein kinase TEL1 n=1 Tax=Tolypocladium capitatum TaxID=45235 RepID=A0A2K3Q907_9HYPO|nr:Serine/threonine-protein kinase TEL1 [Tolypocladium capitatum]
MPSAPGEAANPSRRRPRLSSSSSAATSKRPKFADTPAMASARARGKLPETIDPTPRPSAFQPYTGAKKLVIKNLRAPNSCDAQVEEYYARTERELDGALGAVFAGGRPAVPLERLYRGVEDVCRRGNAEKVYTMLTTRVEAHLRTVVLPRIRRAGGNSNLEVLRSVLAEWKAWNSQAVTIRSTFSYLDRTYLLRESLPSINDMAIAHFRRMAFPQQDTAASSEGLSGAKAVTGICEMIEYDRRGDERMDAGLLKDSVRMLYVLGVYVKHFEPMFLRQSEAYFKEFGASWSASSLKEYISACETLLRREDYRCIAYNLESTTEKQLMDSAHAVLIDHYSDKLLNGGSLSHLLSERDVKSMKGLYDLLRLSGIQKKMKAPWGDYIRTTGASIISDKDRGDDMVLRLLELRRSLDLMIRDAFGRDEDFLWGMREAFGNFMNDRTTSACWDTGTSKIGEMTAKYIDMLLRGGLKALPKELPSDAKGRAAAEKEGHAGSADEDAELDRQLDQALELFRFIEGKDAFEAFYKKDLARRLLVGRSASQDAERNMLTKLRGECGSNFTHNLEQMFKDQELAKDEMEAYRQWSDANSERKPAVDLQVMILSAAAWPTYPDVRVNLPDEVATQIERFDGHYKNKHTGRILTWRHSLAHCAIKATFPKGAKELLVSAFQAVVLMLFNTVPADGFLAYEQISTATGLQGGELDRTLQSLACGKARVLSKHPRGRDVKPTDTFTFNKAFTDPKYRVKINQIQLKETKEENKATHERIAQDRRFETQAAIVRIMKSRKLMGHAELVAEVINLTKKRGSVEPAAIKKEIERHVTPIASALIEKDYLEREDNSYTYLA